MEKKPKVAILYTLAGGGHINVAKSLQSAFEKKYGIKPDLLDLFKTHAPVGFKEPGKLYKFMLKYGGKPHEWFIKAASTDAFLTPFIDALYIAANQKAKEYFENTDYDMFIAVHSVYVQVFERIRYGLDLDLSKVKLVTVVTDIAFMVRAWFSEASDITIVPTMEAYGHGFRFFKKYAKEIEILGLPIQDAWFKEYSKTEVRKELGLELLKKTVLIFGGGEGGSSMLKILKEIEEKCRGIQIVVAVGKDLEVKSKIEKMDFNNKVVILEWTDVFYKYVIASDIVVSKAGPTLIWECMTINKPLIVFDYIKGQEEGNQDFVEDHNIGVYLEEPEEVASYIELFKVTSQDKTMPQKDNYAEKVVERCMKLFA